MQQISFSELAYAHKKHNLPVAIMSLCLIVLACGDKDKPTRSKEPSAKLTASALQVASRANDQEPRHVRFLRPPTYADCLANGLMRPANTVSGASKIYWIDADSRKIQRANLDGCDVEDLVTGLNLPLGIALDVTGGKMYWTDKGTDKIHRSNLDGSNIEDLITGLEEPRRVALDLSGGKIYWADATTDKIQRADLDGANVEDLVTGLLEPRGLALDVEGGKMYWTDRSANKIQRADLDGVRCRRSRHRTE